MCNYCGAGKEPTADHKACQFCNYAEPGVSAGDEVIRRYKSQAGPELCRDSSLVEGVAPGNVALGSEDPTRRHPRPISYDTGTECGKTNFPNKRRDGCRSIVNVTILPSPTLAEMNPPTDRPTYGIDAGVERVGYDNHDDILVEWSFEHVYDFEKDVNVHLCQLKFEMLQVHQKCDGTNTVPMISNILNFAECANRADELNTMYFNYNPTLKECLVINGDCTSYSEARSWYAMHVLDNGWEKGCTYALSANSLTHASFDSTDANAIEDASIQLDHQHGSYPLWTYAKRCVKDDTYLKARIGLDRIDDGAHVNGTELTSGGTGIELETIVYAFSDGKQLIRGNTAPTMQRNKVKVLPKIIFSTSPGIACDVSLRNVLDPDHTTRQDFNFIEFTIQQGKANRVNTPIDTTVTTAASLRIAPTTINRIVDAALRIHSHVEPVHGVAWSTTHWPGDLKLLSYAVFITEIKENSNKLRAFVTECLLDTVAINDAAIVALVEALNVDTSVQWNSFDTNNGGGDELGYKGFGKSMFWRTATHGVLTSQDKVRCVVAVNDGCEDGHSIPGSLETEVIVKELALNRSIHEHSLIDGDRFPATGNIPVEIYGAGFAALRTDYKCTWSGEGLYTPVHKQITTAEAISYGQVACSQPKWMGNYGDNIKLELSGPILEYQGCYNLSKIKDATFIPVTSGAAALNDFNGLASCQLAATSMNVGEQLTGEQLTILALSGETCSFSIAEPSKVLKQDLKVDDSLCNRPCPILWDDAKLDFSTGNTYQAEKKARDYDLLYPQHCGSIKAKDLTGRRRLQNVNNYASVFALVQTENIAAGTYGIATSKPGIPTWKTPVANAGKIVLHWNEPEFLGASVPEEYEIKFKAKKWPTFAMGSVQNEMAYPSSHAALCDESINSEYATSIWSTRGNHASSKQYRLCRKAQPELNYAAEISTQVNEERAVTVLSGNKIPTWTFPSQRGTKTSPVISLDKTTIYFGSLDQYVYAIKISDGSMVWRYNIGQTPMNNSPVLSLDGTLLMIGTSGPSGHMYAIQTSDGTLSWSYGVNNGFNHPVLSLDGTMVYVGSWSYRLYALKVDDGSEQWNYVAGDGTAAGGQYNGMYVYYPMLSLDGETIFVGADDNQLHAVRALDGVGVWKSPTGSGNSIHNGKVFEAVKKKTALSLDGLTIFIMNQKSELHSIQTASGTLNWFIKLSGTGGSGVLLSQDGLSLFVASQGNFFSVKTSNGDIQWTYEDGDNYQDSTSTNAPAALSKDGATLYVGNYDQKLRALKVSDGSLMWSFQATGKTANTPVLSKDGTSLFFGSGSDVYQLYALPLVGGYHPGTLERIVDDILGTDDSKKDAAIAKYGLIKNWDVSEVTNMDNLFNGLNSFNEDLSKWNVGQVISMKSLFRSCNDFNSVLSNWQVGKVTDMTAMFLGNHEFNRDISLWDMSNVNNATEIFSGALKFNADM